MVHTQVEEHLQDVEHNLEEEDMHYFQAAYLEEHTGQEAYTDLEEHTDQECNLVEVYLDT